MNGAGFKSSISAMFKVALSNEISIYSNNHFSHNFKSWTLIILTLSSNRHANQLLSFYLPHQKHINYYNFMYIQIKIKPLNVIIITTKQFNTYIWMLCICVLPNYNYHLSLYSRTRTHPPPFITIYYNMCYVSLLFRHAACACKLTALAHPHRSGLSLYIAVHPVIMIDYHEQATHR